MELAGIESTDILLDAQGQPQAGENGDFAITENLDCWMQDVRNEMLTTEGELFYEDQEDIEAYGFSLVDFINREYDELDVEEIKQRFFEKLAKREDIDESSIEVTILSEKDTYHAQIKFSRLNDSQKYALDVDLSEIEVMTGD